MGELIESGTPQAAPARTISFREDCWSEEATSTLVDAWGRRYLDLNRGNLRQKDWQEVADAVNARHGHTKKTRRTDVQCKNRVDTIKKKYKAEKARVSDSNGAVSSWPFFDRMDVLIGPTASGKARVSPPPMALPLPYRKQPPPPVAQQVVLPQKRPAPSSEPVVSDSYFRRNYSVMAAAAAAEEEDDEGSEDLETSEEESEGRQGGRGDGGGEVEGMKQLARAIERFGEIYQRVEGEKQRQMIEMEKQRMQFSKDLEVQRMQLFMDTQVQLEKMKQAKRSSSNVEEELLMRSLHLTWNNGY